MTSGFDHRYPFTNIHSSHSCHRYLALNDLVNEIFPGERVAPEFNDWNYWKVDLPKIDHLNIPVAPNNYGASSSSLLSSTTSVAKRAFSSSSVQPTSPPTTPADAKGKRASHERTSYASAFLGRSETTTWTSDEEYQDQQHAQDDTIRQNSNDDSRKIRATSPSVLSALVPSRLIRAVRSGNTSNRTDTTTQSQAPLSPEIKSTVGSSPSSPSMVGDDVVRPISPLEGPASADDDMVSASKKALEQDSKVDSIAVKEEEEDDETTARRLLQSPNQDSTTMGDGDGYGEDDEYQGDFDEDGEYADEEDQDDEDDEYLEQIEEEPFL